MKLAQETRVNINLLTKVSANSIETESPESKQWLQKLILYLQDQFLNRKWAYNLTMVLLSAFPVGKYIIAMINALLEEAAKKEANTKV